MIPGIDPRVDYAFKKVFGSEANIPVLLDLLNAVLNPAPDQRIVALELINPFNDKDAADAKQSILDIKARDQLGQQYNIEMQMTGLFTFPDRMLYYWAVLHGQQLDEGDEYGELRATISIVFVNSVVFPDVPDYHLQFQLREARHPDLVFSRQLSMHLLELPKFQRSVDDLTDLRDVWCYFLTHGADLDTEHLPARLSTPAIRRAMEALTMLKQNEQEREQYQARLKWERDRKYLIKTALDEERNRGVLIGRINLCQQLQKLALTPQEELLALSLQELELRAKALEQQLGVANV